jgi:uroporphyrinogen-III synthase
VPERPLGGVRVLVTRPAHQAEGLVRLIEAAGGEAVRLPTIEITEPADPAALERALASLPHASHALFISPNAVEHGLARLREHGGWPAGLRFVAVGAGTVRALQAEGIQNVLAPAGRFDSEAVLELLPAGAVHGRVLLLFRGEGGREHLAETLAARGARVEQVICYRRIVPRHTDNATLARLARGELDVITITSVEGLHNLLTLAGSTSRARLLATPLILTSERQAQAARAAGFHAQPAVAARADDAAIVAALIAWREARKSL